MVPLDSPVWKTLSHAYGSGDNIPDLIRRLEKSLEVGSPDLEAWHHVTSSLCHQYSVYSATWAAVPHIAALARRAPAALQAQFLIFLGAVARSSEHADPEAVEALQSVLPAVAGALSRETPAGEFAYLAATWPSLHGHALLATACEGLADKEIATSCPNCASDLFAWPTDDPPGLGVTDEVPTTETLFTPIKVDLNASPPVTSLLQTIRALSGRTDNADDAARIALLTGRFDCPSCGESVSMPDAIREYHG